MGRRAKRRRFGSMPVRTDRKSGRRYIEARYQPPVEAYSRWPSLPKRISRRFPVGFETEAEKWLNDAETSIRMGTWQPPEAAENAHRADNVTFGEYAAGFVRNRRKVNGEPIAATTRQKYEQYLRDYLLPVLGNLPMAAVTPRDIQRWADSMKVGKAGEGASIKRHTWELLNAIFRQACSQPLDDKGTTLLSSNPVLLRVDRPRSDRAYGDVSMEELNTLYEAMPGRFALVIYLVGVLSLRPGEAYALQRGDMNLADDGTGGRLHVGKSAKGVMRNGHKVMTVGSTKTPGSVRDLDIPPFMIPAISRHLDRYVADSPKAWLFTGERTHSLVFDQSVRNAWYRARKAVPRLEKRKLRLYDLRHRALTEVAKHTNSLKAVMAQGGHTQVSTAMHYQHVTESEREKILAGMEEVGEAALSSSKHESSHVYRAFDYPPGTKTSLMQMFTTLSPDAKIAILSRLNLDEQASILQMMSPEVLVETMAALLGETKETWHK